MMKHRITATLISFQLAILVAASPALAQLGGTYTVGSAPSNYATITAAVNALNAQGISLPVTFEIKNGTYDEQVTIDFFTRAGPSTDLVTFKPASGATVTWEFTGVASSTNWVVQIDSARYLRFEGINFVANTSATYGRILEIENGSQNITVDECSFTGIIGASASTGTLVQIDGAGGGTTSDFTFEDSDFSLGYHAIRTNPLGGSVSDTIIRRNTFGGQYDAAVYLQAAVGSTVNRNTITDAAWTGSSYIAIFAEGAAEIKRNEIDLQKGDAGIWVLTTDIGGVGSQKLIENNLISMRGSGADYGIYAPANSTDIYHNTVRMAIAGDGLVLAADRQDIDVRNNIFVNDAGGYAMSIPDAAAIETSDYNILYTTGAYPVRWDGMDYADLADYRIDSGNDILSFDVPVTFVDILGASDLRLDSPSNSDVDLLAPEVAGITQDIDGDPRGTYSVYRGADEGIAILPLDNADTGSGFYTVGGSTPDFANPTEAIENLNLRGIKGDVTFRVRAGNYTVHRRIDFVNHVAADALAKTTVGTDTVLFRAANPNTRPTFQYAATSSGDNWILKVVEADRVKIRNIDFEATGTPPYGRVIELEGEVDDFSIAQCNVTGLAGETSTHAALIYSDEFEQDRFTLQNCSLSGGSYGVHLKTVGVGTKGEDSKINYNYFDDQAVAGMLVEHEDLEVIADTVISGRDDVVGIYLYDARNPIVERNVVRAHGNGGIAMVLSNTNGSTFDLSPVENNFLAGRSIGLMLERGARLHGIYHNTMRATDYATYIEASGVTVSDSVHYLVNNIMQNTSTGPALFVESGDDVHESDFNNLTNDGGGTLVSWEGASYATLGAYQAAVTQDANSVSTSVSFVDAANGDLHLDGASDGDQDLIGTPLAAVPTDIDGQLRSGTQPYMGADEATPFTMTLGMTVFLEGPYALGLMSRALNTGGHLAANATGHPYGGSPWNYPGSESVAAAIVSPPSTVIDWVYLKLYEGTLPNVTVVDSTVGLLLSDGSVVSHADTTQSVGFDVPAGSYYPAVFHRNHIGIIASSLVNMAVPSPFYDFTGPGSQAYGTNPMKDLGGGDFGLFGADATNDGQVTAGDFNLWLTDTKAAATGYLLSDFNMDGQVTAADFNVWLTNTKAAASSQIP